MQMFLRRVVGRVGLYEVVAFLCGFVLMAFELAASRILAPAIGTSTYVWTSVIGVMIAALAAGYAVGGWIADQRGQLQDIIWLLLLTALCILTTCLFYGGFLSSLSLAVHDSRLQGIIASTILFVPASFLLGVISPYLAKLRVKSVSTTGRSVAGLSAANAIGSIAGTFGSGFILFTLIGSRETLALLAGVLIASSWLIAPSIQRRFRVVASIALSVVILLQFIMPVSAGTVAEIDTPTSHYKISDITLDGRPTRVLVMGPGGWQWGVYLDGSKDLAFSYTRKIAEVAAAAPHHDNILILGGGAFSLPEYLGRTYPHAQIDVAEIDPRLPDIAKKYFNYRQPANVRVYAQDARAYLETTTTRYDVIIVDVYSDSNVPFALTTREYTAALARRLQPDGVVIANIIGASTPACMPLLASMHDSYQNAFDHALYYPLDDPTLQSLQNIIGVYSNGPLQWANNIPGSIFIGLHDTHRLTDNYAPVEYLQQRCGS